MSILRLTGIYRNRTVSEWVSALSSPNEQARLRLMESNGKSITDDSLIWMLANRAVPFMILGVEYEEKMNIIRGGAELIAIRAFLSDELEIGAANLWSKSQRVTFSQFDLGTQQNILRCVIPAEYCQVDSWHELEVLRDTIR